MRYIIGGFTVLAVIAAAAWAKHMHDRHGLGPLLWRWHSGQALDGHARTNATWLHRSSDVLHYTGHAIWWHHQPRLQRAGIRCGAEAVLLASLAGLVLAPGITVPLLAASAAAGLACAGMYGWRHFHGLWFHVRWVRPLRRNLELNHGVPPRSLRVSRDRTRVSLSLPPGWKGTQRERDMLTAIVCSKLGMGEIEDPAWAEHHRRPHVRMTAAAPPPDRVELADPRVQAAIAACGPGQIMAGIGRRGAEVIRSVDTDSPHLGISMGSGRGKSVTAGNSSAQLAAQGAVIAVLDYKIVSHRWAKGLPNVAYASRPWQIHQLLLWLEGAINDRNDLIDAHADIDGNVSVAVGQRLGVIAEETGTMQKILARYWRECRAADRSLPARSPASEALDIMLAMGRQGLVNVQVISQRLSVAAVSGAGGNADARENLGLIWMCDPGPSTWRMLGPDIPCPPPRNHPGRQQLVDPAGVTEVQGVLATNRGLRALAVSGDIASPPPGMPFVSRAAQAFRDADGAWTWQQAPPRELVTAGGPTTSARAERAGPDLFRVADADLVGEAVDAGAQDEHVTLADAVHLGIAKVNLTAARRRSCRDPRHPAPTGKAGKAFTYNACDLADYYAKAAA